MSIFDDNEVLVGAWRNPDVWFDNDWVRGDAEHLPTEVTIAHAQLRARYEHGAGHVMQALYREHAEDLIHPFDGSIEMPEVGDRCGICFARREDHDRRMVERDAEFRRIGVWAHVLA